MTTFKEPNKEGKVMPPLFERIGKEFLGIPPVEMEKFLRWVHGKGWASSTPQDILDKAKIIGIVNLNGMPLSDVLKILHKAYQREIVDGKKEDRTDT